MLKTMETRLLTIRIAYNSDLKRSCIVVVTYHIDLPMQV